MRVVPAEVMKEYRDVVNHTTLAVALIVGGTEVVASHVVVVSDFAVLRAVWIERSVSFVADATFGGVVVRLLLITTERPHFNVPLKVFKDLRLPPDELVEEFSHCVFTRVETKLVVICLHRGAKDGL